MRATGAARVRFILTATLLVAARALDAVTTWIATPDLSLETNPLQRLLHFGWIGMGLVNLLVVAALVTAAWRAAVTPPALPRDAGLDFHAFIARYWFSRADRRSVTQAVFWLPADRRVRWAFIGGPGAVLVIVGSIVVASWNLLVARGVVTSAAAARLCISALWLGLVLGLCLAVRVFLRRAYHRYTRLASPA